jgi:hypothetical protein
MGFFADKAEAIDVVSLVQRMPKWLRIRWLRLCCLRYSLGKSMRTDVVSTSGELQDVLNDFYSIVGQAGSLLTLEWATMLAEQLLRRKYIQDAVARAGE